MINRDAESIYSTIHQDITPYCKDLLQNCYKIRKRVLPNTLLLKTFLYAVDLRFLKVKST